MAARGELGQLELSSLVRELHDAMNAWVAEPDDGHGVNATIVRLQKMDVYNKLLSQVHLCILSLSLSLWLYYEFPDSAGRQPC